MRGQVDVPIIASGGAGAAEDFAVADCGPAPDAVLAASVFHYGRLTIREVKQAMATRVTVPALEGSGSSDFALQLRRPNPAVECHERNAGTPARAITRAS